MVEHLAEWVTEFMALLGYPGLFLLMVGESMIAPVPSEVVMPFAGFLVHDGRMTLWGAIAASSLGTLVGSLLGYYMGKYGGYPVVHRFGRYLLLEPHHLHLTRVWFEKHGEITVFVSRFIPVVRHLISIPAGAGNMNLFRFCLFTVIGGTMWNVFLLYCGIWLGARWNLVQEYTHALDYVVLAGLIVVGVWFIWRQWLKRKGRAPQIKNPH